MEMEEFFKQLDRSLFMTINKELAQIDMAFPIGYEQTISQPSLVLFMTKTLGLTKEDRVLELGTGSGYQTAFLANYSKHVYTIERIEPLQKHAKEVLDQLGYGNITYIVGDGSYGLKEYAPYDRIIVTAAVKQIPENLINQLRAGGKMIIPVGTKFMQDLVLVKKDENDNIEMVSLEAVRFVPLKGEFEND